MALLKTVLTNNGVRHHQPPVQLRAPHGLGLKAPLQPSHWNTLEFPHSNLRLSEEPLVHKEPLSAISVLKRAFNPPEPLDILGSEPLPHFNALPITAARGYSVKSKDHALISVVLYHYGSKGSKHPTYYEQSQHDFSSDSNIRLKSTLANVRGEVRMHLHRSDSIASVGVELVSSAQSTPDTTNPPFFLSRAVLWDRTKGHPCESDRLSPMPSSSEIFEKRFPRGSYVFPFEFNPFPREVQVQGAGTQSPARVLFPPSYSFNEAGGFSGSIKHEVVVKVVRDSFGSVNSEIRVPIYHVPRRRPISLRAAPAPFPPLKGNWPIRREVRGAWGLTPFGGTGRFQGKDIELECLLATQTPSVCSPNDTIKFVLDLRCTSPCALSALTADTRSRPNYFDVAFVRADFTPHRVLSKLSKGCVWRVGESRPVTEGCARVDQHKIAAIHDVHTAVGCSPRPKPPPVPSRYKNVTSFSKRADDATPTRLPISHVTSPQPTGASNVVRNGRFPPLFDDPAGVHSPPLLAHGTAATMRLEGDVRVMDASTPSFRFQDMGCEYAMTITITHPEYSSSSSDAPGRLSVEIPICIVSDPPRSAAAEAEVERLPQQVNIATLPILGDAVVPVSPQTVRASLVRGEIVAKSWRNRGRGLALMISD